MSKRESTARDRDTESKESTARVTPLRRAKVASTPPLQRLREAMAAVERAVGHHFPEQLAPVKAALAVIAVGCIKDNMYPTTLMFVGPSGSGKTLTLRFVLPDEGDEALNALLYRSDEFSAASFVSQASSETSGNKNLSKVDLLPRIENKTLVTKELAPMFRGQAKELMGRFNKLTSVLDGMGFVSDSGTHGRRGYAKPINFQWLGATTPLNKTVLRVMETLGPRIVFYDTARPYKSEDELVEVMLQGDSQHSSAVRECYEAARRLIVALYELYRPDDAPCGVVQPSTEQAQTLVRWAKVLTRLRASLPDDNQPSRAEREKFLTDLPDDGDDDLDDVVAETEGAGETEVAVVGEQPERAMFLLRRIAVGSALAHGRTNLNDFDLAQIAHITLSSGHRLRAGALRSLLEHGGTTTTPQVAHALGVSAPTARTAIENLVQAGIAEFVVRGDQAKPHTVKLDPAFAGLAHAPMLKDFGGERVPE